MRGRLRSEEDPLQPLRALVRAGRWEDIFSALAGAEAAPDRLFIDSICIKVHRCAGGGKGGALAHGIGLTKGGRNTKLHAVCDEKGRPVVLLLTPGNVHDCKVAELCIEAMPPSAELVADKGYDLGLDGPPQLPDVPVSREFPNSKRLDPQVVSHYQVVD